MRACRKKTRSWPSQAPPFASLALPCSDAVVEGPLQQGQHGGAIRGFVDAVLKAHAAPFQSVAFGLGTAISTPAVPMANKL